MTQHTRTDTKAASTLRVESPRPSARAAMARSPQKSSSAYDKYPPPRQERIAYKQVADGRIYGIDTLTGIPCAEKVYTPAHLPAPTILKAHAEHVFVIIKDNG